MLGGQYGGGNCDEDSAPESTPTGSTDNSTQCGINISCFTKMLISQTYSGGETSFDESSIYNSILSQSTIWLQSIFSFLLWNEVGVSSVPKIIEEFNKIENPGSGDPRLTDREKTVQKKKIQSELKELYTEKSIPVNDSVSVEIKLIDNMTKQISGIQININLLVNANNDFKFEDGSTKAFEYFKYKLLQKFPKLTIDGNKITLNLQDETGDEEEKQKKKI